MASTATATAAALRAIRGGGLSATGISKGQAILPQRYLSFRVCAAATSTTTRSSHAVSPASISPAAAAAAAAVRRQHPQPVLQHISSQPPRAFLSTQPQAADEISAGEASQVADAVQASATARTPKSKPSILTTLPEGYSSGMALYALRNHIAGGRFVRHTDVRDMALAARPGCKRDARAIRTALKDFKRCNRYSIDVLRAQAAMEGMHRAMTFRDPTPEDKVSANLFVLDAFVDEKTGLYFAAETKDVDIHLKNLLEAAKESNLALPTDFGSEDAANEDGEADGVAEEEEGGEGSDDAAASVELAKHVLHTTRDVMAALCKRGFKPERHMKKNAARKYLKQLRAEEGPTASTAHVGVEICLELGASAKLTRDMVLTPYRAHRNKADEETVLLVVNKKAAEKEAIITAEAVEEKAKAEAEAEAAAAAAAEKAATKETEEDSSSDDSDDNKKESQ